MSRDRSAADRHYPFATALRDSTEKSALSSFSAVRYDRTSAKLGFTGIGGAVEGSGDAYGTLIVRVAESFPEVAAQVRADVAAGLDISADDQYPFDYIRPRTRATEITTRKFSDDEKLQILLTALITATRTAIEARQRIAASFEPDMNRASRGYRITFASPDTDEDLLTLSADQLAQIGELASALEGLEQALALLEPR